MNQTDKCGACDGNGRVTKRGHSGCLVRIQCTYCLGTGDRRRGAITSQQWRELQKPKTEPTNELPLSMSGTE